MKVSKKLWAVMIGYTVWMILITILVSPLGLDWLTYYEMGFRADTLLNGIIIGLIVSVMLGAGELLPIPLRKMMMKDIQTVQQFNDMWKVQMIGGLDGFIAEPYWSGAILPLSIKLFTSLNLATPVVLVSAVLLRWLLHILSHYMFPSVEHGQRAFGEMISTSIGLLILDAISSAAFLLSGSIIAPAIIHTFMQPFAQLFGVKKKLLKELELQPTKDGAEQ
jgi:hypothetical protein